MKIYELHPGNCCEWSVRTGIALLVKRWTRNLSMMQGTLFPESAFSVDCLTVFIQPRCAIVCINVCAALKIPNPLSSRWSIVWYPWLCPHWEAETETDTGRQRQVDRVLRSLRRASKIAAANSSHKRTRVSFLGRPSTRPWSANSRAPPWTPWSSLCRASRATCTSSCACSRPTSCYGMPTSKSEFYARSSLTCPFYSLSLPPSLPLLLSPSVCVSVCLSLSVSLFVSLSLSLSLNPSLSLSFSLSLPFSLPPPTLSLPPSLFLSLSVCLSVPLHLPSPTHLLLWW